MSKEHPDHPLGREAYALGPYAAAVEARLGRWEAEQLGPRLWDHDPTVWIADPEQAAQTPELTDRLGWLTLPQEMAAALPELTAEAEQIRREGFTAIVVLGMGGSSLAPELFGLTFGPVPGYPCLRVLDSTHPAAVERMTRDLDLAAALFVVSSKSGGTVETLSFYRHFRERLRRAGCEPGRHCCAITDPGSSLEALAREEGFRRVWPGPPPVGGRYSALAVFGLAPAALMGAPVAALLDSAAHMAQRCGPHVQPRHNPGLRLGAALGELALAGRDKLTLLISPAIASLGAWTEQLLAESTGKLGRGLLPVPEARPGPPEVYAEDRAFVYLRLEGDDNAALDAAFTRLQRAGYPTVRLEVADRSDLGGEFFRWEMATAAAGATLGINPFDQPDVQAAKRLAAEAMAQYADHGALPQTAPALVEGEVALLGDPGAGAEDLAAALGAFLSQARTGDYVALQAFVAPDQQTEAALAGLADLLRDRLQVAVTVGYGPRFLHSTGQLHKGDAGRGLFLQITDTPPQDLPVPSEAYSFGVLIAAQAQGDFRALQDRGRRVIRLHLQGETATGLQEARRALDQALSAG